MGDRFRNLHRPPITFPSNMEGHKLILKRKIPKGRQKLAAIFIGAFAVVALISLAQLKTTLSANALASVREDFGVMQGQMKTQADAASELVKPEEQVALPTPEEEAVEKFKKLIQDVPVQE